MKQPYFPIPHEMPDCTKCEKLDCWSRGKYQRNRRDFTYTSGRCPRLPDRRGFVEKEERKAYAEAFPLAHAERDANDSVCLTISQPGQRSKRLYMTYGHWWFRDKLDEMPVRRVVTLSGVYGKQDLINQMGNSDYCIFRCEVENYYI